MNIKLIFILIIIIIIINLYENFIIKKELYNEDLLKTLINLDQQLNEICISSKLGAHSFREIVIFWRTNECY